ncbi:hypothetical protein ABTB06_20135, partial [Acinetobacter baumannii]
TLAAAPPNTSLIVKSALRPDMNRRDRPVTAFQTLPDEMDSGRPTASRPQMEIRGRARAYMSLIPA